MDQVADRRSHARVPFVDNVRIMLKDTTLPRCPSCDISHGGIGLATSLPVETRLHLVLTLPLDNEIQTLLLEGTVCWRKLNACGVRFENVSSQARVCLTEYILSRSPPKRN